LKISVAVRYHPFSHDPGASCLLPRTCCAIEAFPTLLRLGSLEIPLKISGPVREFTLQQDLEKGCVFVWGIAQEGRFRFRLEAEEGMLNLNPEKAPEGMFTQFSWKLPGPYCEPPMPLERISFGSHKSQDWDQVKRRADLKEILPVLFALSQWTPVVKSVPTAMSHLLDSSFESFFSAGFSGILNPRLIDEQFQGLLPNEEIPDDALPCSLIAEAGKKIRSQLLKQAGSSIILPAPLEFCGRMLHAHLEGIGLLDFEWTKGLVKRAILRAHQDAQLSLELPSVLRSFRLRTSLHEKGLRMDGASQWEVKKDHVYYLDRFEK
jgi:hypothetical protein